MANTLNDLIPDLYASMDIVSRELVGFIPAVTMDARVNRAAKGQDVIVPIAPVANDGFDITPAMSIPAAADQTIGNTKIQITKSRGRPFSWNGNEQDGLNSNGPGYLPIRANQMLQAMRALVNEVESDLAALHITTSRAHGSAGQTPFATAGNFTDATYAHKILKDNGCPLTDNQLVLDTTAGAEFAGKQSNSSVEFDAGLMRQGVLRTIDGLDLRQSGQVKTSVAGTMSGGTVATGGYAVGATVLSLKNATGTGAAVPGDVITIADDTNKYVVAAVSQAGANPATGDTITLAEPGLRKAIVGEKVITIIGAAARNMLFNRSAIVLATRMPERPSEGDLALDVTSVTDPRSGLTFEVSVYPGNRMVRYEIALAWGVKNIKPAHTALLLG